MTPSSSTNKTFDDLLADDAARTSLFEDAETILSSRVAASRGLTGMAIRTGYAAFQRVQPGIVPAALERLAPRFAPVVEPHWQTARTTNDPVGWFTSHASPIADDLLSVTDGMADRAKNPVLVSIYRSLRSRAHDEVAAGMPDVAGLLLRHLG